MNLDAKGIMALVVAVTVCVAFLGVALAPYFHVVIDPTTQTFVFGLFAAAAGGGGAVGLIQVTQNRTVATLNAASKNG